MFTLTSIGQPNVEVNSFVETSPETFESYQDVTHEVANLLHETRARFERVVFMVTKEGEDYTFCLDYAYDENVAGLVADGTFWAEDFFDAFGLDPIGNDLTVKFVS